MRLKGDAGTHNGAGQNLPDNINITVYHHFNLFGEAETKNALHANYFVKCIN